jgi:hypothetical protein
MRLILHGLERSGWNHSFFKTRQGGRTTSKPCSLAATLRATTLTLEK